MSKQAREWARHQQGLTPAQKAILLELGYHANAIGENAYPGNTRLAYDLCMDLSTVKRNLEGLQSSGHIELQKRRGPGRGLANVWRLPMDKRVQRTPIPTREKGAENPVKGCSASNKRVRSAPPIEEQKKEDAFSKQASSLTSSKPDSTEADNRTFEGASSSPPPPRPQPQPHLDKEEDQTQVATGDGHENPDSGDTLTSVDAEGQIRCPPPADWKHQLDHLLPSDPADTRWYLKNARLARDERRIKVLENHLARQEAS